MAKSHSDDEAKQPQDPTKKPQEQFIQKIQDLQTRLVGNFDLKDLQGMQLQIDLLEDAAGLAYDFHHHDTNEHHDHVGKPEFLDILRQTK